MSIPIFEIAQSGSKLKASLRLETRGESFRPDINQVNKVITEIRKGLGQLRRLYLEQNGTPDYEELELKQVRSIAVSGQILKDLFLAEAPSDCVECLENNIGSKLGFEIDGQLTISVPWGLLFGPPNTKIDCSKLDMPGLKAHFWCHKYDLFSISRAQTGTLSAVLSSDTEFMFAHHPQVLAHADPSGRVNWPQELRYSSGRDFTAAWYQDRKDEQFIYFFCHADESGVWLNRDDHLPYGVLGACINAGGTSAKRVSGIMFLNGCSTAVSEERDNWLRAWQKKGFLGFIGTEEAVPTKLAWRFGNDFLYLVLRQSWTPIRAMRELRDKYWPLSLLWALYCLPEVIVAPCPSMEFLPLYDQKSPALLPCEGGGTLSTLPFQQDQSQ